MLNPEHVPEVEKVNVCGNVTDAPDEGLFNVAEQTVAASVNDLQLDRHV
jgi:hypothetical protein